MLTKGEVLSVNGDIIKVKTHRSSMCDGCHKSSCGESCAASGLMGGGKSVTVDALNAANAEVGDTVELESRDSVILFLALVVFIFPLVMCAAMYALGAYVLSLGNYSFALAFVGFLLSYVVIGALERKHRKSRPDVTAVRIVKRADGDIAV